MIKEKIIKALSVISMALVVMVYAMTKLFIHEKKNLSEATKSLDKQKKNSKVLKEHQEKIDAIHKESKKVEEKIDNAKTDEDLLAVAGDIVSANNKRVCNDKKKSDSSTTRTRKKGTSTTKVNG